MNVNIRHYDDADEKAVIGLLDILQSYVVEIDPLERNICHEKYASSYFQVMMRKVIENEGVIFVADVENIVSGFVAGIIERPKGHETMEIVGGATGRVEELVVMPKYRNRHLGKALMERCECHFREQGCSAVTLDVFSPNVSARNFYEKLGYSERMMTLLKVLD